jgi:hypothetical protein
VTMADRLWKGGTAISEASEESCSNGQWLGVRRDTKKGWGALSVVAHREDGLTVARHRRGEALMKESMHGGYDELCLNGELLWDLHMRRGGHWGESPTVRRMGEK